MTDDEDALADIPPARLAGSAAAAVAEVEAALRVPNDPVAAAFFDLDNTVVRGASIFYLAMGLARRKFFTRRARDVVKFARNQVMFRVYGSEDAIDVADLTEMALGFVQGHPEFSEVVTMGREIFDERIAAKVYPRTIAVARAPPGRRPASVARVRRAGGTGHDHRETSWVDRRARHCLGDSQGRLHRKAGRSATARARQSRSSQGARGARKVSLCPLLAYSDSSNDIPMLSLVGDPCAVNPDRKLRRHARDLGWRIVDYRTGRKAAIVVVPALAGAGALAGIVVGAVALDRRRR